MFNIKIDPVLAKNQYDRVEAKIKKQVKLMREDSTIYRDGFKKILDWLSNEYNLKELIISEPKRLTEIYQDWKNSLNYKIGTEWLFSEHGILPIPSKEDAVEENVKQAVSDAHAYLHKIFNYDGFSDKDKGQAYTLAKELNVRICPYCNRSFTVTVDRLDDDQSTVHICRPEFDHYFPQSRYPMFSLSFYNLIPCCHTCNSVIKLARELELTKHFHPYIDEDKNFSFFATIENTIAIEYNDNKKAEATCQFFDLPSIYQSHNDEVTRIMALKQKFNHTKIIEIQNSLNISHEDAMKLVFSHYEDADEDTEVLGKLRSDLYMQIIPEYDECR